MKTIVNLLFPFFFALIFSISPVFSAQEDAPPLVWFIHGMKVGNATFQDSLILLQKIFPNAEDWVIKDWPSPKEQMLSLEDYYLKSRVLAEQYSRRLLSEIEALSPEDQHRLILVGHSLGGRIVVRTLATGYRKERLQIRQMIIAGTAAASNDQDLADAVNASRLTAYSLINPKDFMLTTAYRIAEKQAAMGTGALLTLDSEEFYEIRMPNTTSHHARDYFTFLLTCIQKDDFSNTKIIVPQDVKMAEIATVPAFSLNWETTSSFAGWKLQHNKLRGHYRILTDQNICVAEGRESFMIPSFKRVCQQLKQKELLHHIAQTQLPAGQDPEANLNVLGSSGFWGTLRELNGWRIQKSFYLGKYRLIDPYGFRYAIGELEEVVQFYSQEISGKR